MTDHSFSLFLSALPDPGKFTNPCNCFGTQGQMEGDQDFHEMGAPGCRRDPNVLTQEDLIRNAVIDEFVTKLLAMKK